MVHDIFSRLSVDFRRKVLSVRSQERLTFQQVADRFGVGGASVVRWSRCLEPQLTRNKPATRINMDALARDVEACPDAYQSERAVRFGVRTSAICYALKRLGVTYKKKPYVIPRRVPSGVQPSGKQSRRMKPQAGLLCIWMKVGLPGCNTTCRGRMAIASAVSAAYQTGVQRDAPM